MFCTINRTAFSMFRVINAGEEGVLVGRSQFGAYIGYFEDVEFMQRRVQAKYWGITRGKED